MKKQILVIHGGWVFDTYKKYINYLRKHKIDFDKLKTRLWKENLSDRLGKDFEVILPKMPNPTNAKYKEWKIMFEKLFPFFKNDIILLGHSLGGIFLAKYLSENKFPKKIKATFLVAAPYDDKTIEESLGDFKLPKNLDRFQGQGGKIFLYQSKDDSAVSLIDLEKYKKSLPKAEIMMFKDKGHFTQVEFPEIVKHIKKIK